MKTKIELKDFTLFNFVSNVAYNPSGSHAAFVVHKSDFDGNKYNSNLWVLDCATKKYHKLTATNTERSFVWENDCTILFASARSKPEQGTTDFYRINIDGGEAVKAFTAPYRVTKIEPLGDGKHILSVWKKIIDRKPEKNEAVEGKDYIAFDELPHWFNGQGVINRQRATLFTFDEKTGEGKQFTSEYFNVVSSVVTPCKKAVIFSGSEYEDVLNGTGSINCYMLESGETKTLVPQDKEMIGQIACIDGEVFFTACTKNHQNIWHNHSWYAVNPVSGERREIGFFDFGIGAGISSDSNYGGGDTFCTDNGKLYFTMADRVNSRLGVLCDNAPKILSKEDGGIMCLSVRGEKAIIVAMRGLNLAELYEMDLSTGCETKLTNFNDSFGETKTVCPVEYTTFVTDYGVDLDCYVIKPAGYKEGNKYPAVFSMHGGPKAIFGGLYHHEMQAQANDGYFVFYTNPRGSDGRGDDFANALIGDMGGPDYQDFMAFFDFVLAKCPDIDDKKVAICGGSYAGFMINWMIGHTDRFAAAAPQRSIANYMSKGLTTDIGYSHNMTQLGTTPWEDFDKVWSQSPLAYVYNAKTPTCFIQSDEDFRCWMSEPLQMFNALKRSGVPTKMCLFHGENHELSRSGKPQNRLSRLEEIQGWFNKYCK